ncbi:MAG: hypothetical protein U0987_15565 [Afipia sp.]|jgi:hypothetical protein|nr:hypothetical protein [Afipia sp.]
MTKIKSPATAEQPEPIEADGRRIALALKKISDPATRRLLIEMVEKAADGANGEERN